MTKLESFIIEGLGGKKTLKGSVSINGAKNAALKAMAAAILFDGPVTLENIPDTSDVHTQSDILVKLGAKVAHDTDKHILVIDPTTITSTDLDYDMAQNMRSSVVLTGPLLSRFKSASFPAPGGCVLGARPIDLFIEGYKKMGAEVELTSNLYKIKTSSGLTGTEIFFNIISVGGTETLMMAAVLANGTTTLKNCALEPEITNVAEWLNSCGANITGAGTSTIIITGTNGRLLSPTKNYVTVPDRIEAGSYLILGALCADSLTIMNCRPDHMDAVINLLRDSGIDIETSPNEIRILNNASKPNNRLSAFNFRTHEYPGFPTDLQAPMVTYLTQVTGQSSVFETIFEGRFKYVDDLNRAGANINISNSREIEVNGPSELSQTASIENLKAHDIRAGFAVVLAALVGNGKFTVTNVHLIDRGYEKLEERLRTLGASITRVSSN